MLTADITDAAQVADAIAQVNTAFGRLDVLVNNAGRHETLRRIGDADADLADWWDTCKVNVRGTYLVTRTCLPLLLAHGAGTVVKGDKLKVRLDEPL